MTTNDEYDGSLDNRTRNREAEAADDILDELLEQFDTAWATGAMPLPSSLDRELPHELRGELNELKTCIALLNQAARQGSLTVFDHETGVAADTPIDGATRDDPGFAGERIDRFEIVRELGRGGYGIVFLAHDADMDRDVALKLPRPEALISPELRRRFLREAKAAGRLDHPHILPIFEAGDDGGLCYLISPFCRGPSLAKWLSKQQDVVDPHAAANLVASLAEGLDQAHRLGVLHRDIKPGNVLLDLSATEQIDSDALLGRPLSSFIPKLGDFGLAKLLEAADQDTRTGAQLGTPSYMAPELTAGSPHEVGPAADIYALGAVLYELLVGKPPHAGATDAETLRLAATADPTPPRRLRPSSSRDLEAVVLKCLERQPADRYATAGELATDLHRFIAGDSTVARPAGVVRHVWKWGARRKAVAALAGLAVVLLATMTIGEKWYSAQLERERAAVVTRMYSRDMAMATEARLFGAYEDAVALVDKYADNQPNSKLRGFEWYWLEHALHEEQQVIPTRHGEAYTVLFSPDEQTIYTGGKDGVIRAWSRKTGSLQGELRGHTACVNQIALTADGRHLFSCGCDHTLRRWDVESRTEAGIVGDHPVELGCLALARRHPWIATGGYDGAVRVWNYETNESLATLRLAERTLPVTGVAFRPDDGYLVATCATADSAMWEAGSWREVGRDPLMATALAYRDDGKELLLSSRNKDIGIVRWQMPGAGQVELLHDLPPELQCLSPSSGRPLVYAGSTEGIVWCCPLNGPTRRAYSAGPARIQASALSRDGNILATVGFDGALRIWDLTPPHPSIAAGDGRQLLKCAIAHGRPWVAAGISPHSVHLYDRSSGATLAVALGGPPVGFSPGHHYIVTTVPGTEILAVAQIKLKTGELLPPENLKFGFPVTSVAISADDSTVAAMSINGQIEVFELATGKLRGEFQLPRADAYAQEPVLSADGSKLYWLERGTLSPYGYEIDSKRQIAPPGDVAFLAQSAVYPGRTKLSPDGRYAAFLGDHSLRIQDVRTGEVVHRLRHVDGPNSNIAWSPDGRRIAVHTAAETVLLYDPSSGELTGRLDGGPDRIRSNLAFSQDGRSLSAITTGEDRLTGHWRLWPAPRQISPDRSALPAP